MPQNMLQTRRYHLFMPIYFFSPIRFLDRQSLQIYSTFWTLRSMVLTKGAVDENDYRTV